ncbi:uncharacterized protein UTRI_05148_B [Ustilago trichophora]|uniref:monoamine oxidase n=1 Tax=Ustilago trichophora TaxID=86804 RepID=A0A5C3EDZ2_9BASI|nr:uncharacterized protein UTRI_05148_B [Ustilago trichophora]
MTKQSVLIVGGGLSGLYLARQLQQQSDQYQVTILESRDRLGGRLESAKVTLQDGSQDGFDLGGSWFWPSKQPKLSSLIQDLRLQSFAQYEHGDLLIERSQTRQAQRLDPRGLGMADARRLRGGMRSLINALADQLDPHTVRLGCHVTSIRLIDTATSNSGAPIQAACDNGDLFHTDTIILALPPRLAASGAISFEPSLPVELLSRWSATPTWMAPHAKYVAVYQTPFWRDQQLSGNAHSTAGPLGEIHDASNFDASTGALFGFFSIPSQARLAQSQDQLKAACRAQLTRLFGHQATTPHSEFLRDWAAEKATATEADAHSGMPSHHDSSGPLPATPDASSTWHSVLIGAGSEWSPAFPGYIAGAIDAADRALAMIVNSCAST